LAQVKKRNGLKTDPVWKALLSLAGPMVLGIIGVMSVALVDSYFVGLLGTQPLAALSFAFPVVFTMTSLAIGLSAGAASVVSRSLGAENDDQARRYATDSLLLSLIIVIGMCLLLYAGLKPLFRLMDADGEVLVLIVRYMDIWILSMPFLVIPMVANAIIRASGDALWPSAIMIGSAVINVLFTPLLIFGWGPIPAFDIEGAAWGTFLARILSLAVSFYVLAYKDQLLTFCFPDARTLWKGWKNVLAISLPAGMGNMVNPLGIALVTAFLAGFSDGVVAGFGVATRIEAFAAIPMLALSSAIGPFSGQNWAARQKQRVQSAIQICFGFCLVWSGLLALLFWFTAPFLADLFAPDDIVREKIIFYLQVVPISLWGYGFVINCAALFNALGKSVVGLGYYLVRSLVFYVPLSWLASVFLSSNMVFVAIALSNALAGLICAFLILHWLKNHEPAYYSERT
jgi:putative MATE family efflux protein